MRSRKKGRLRSVVVQFVAVTLLFFATFSQAIASQAIDAVAMHNTDMQHGDHSAMHTMIDCDQGCDPSGDTQVENCRDVCERICAQQFSECFTSVSVTGRYSKDVSKGWAYETVSSFGGFIEDRPPRTN